MQDGKMNFMKPQLKIEIERVSANPGDILVICPRDRFDKFTEEYLGWLRDNLAEVMRPGVRAMILNDRSTGFDVLTPEPSYGDDEDLQKIYDEGWRDAFAALERCYAKDPIDPGNAVK